MGEGGPTSLLSTASTAGFIFAMGIDKYVNVLLNPSVVDRRIRLQYLSQSEVVEERCSHPTSSSA